MQSKITCPVTELHSLAILEWLGLEWVYKQPAPGGDENCWERGVKPNLKSLFHQAVEKVSSWCFFSLRTLRTPILELDVREHYFKKKPSSGMRRAGVVLQARKPSCALNLPQNQSRTVRISATTLYLKLLGGWVIDRYSICWDWISWPLLVFCK